MNRDRLFLKTLEDLETRINSQDDYEILMVAALLRKLLLDAYPLMDQVNEKRRLKIRFVINDYQMPVIKTLPTFPTFWSIEDGLDPEMARIPKPIEVSRDEFLARQILKNGNHFIAIKELIKHAAHVQGTIHAGEPEDEKQKHFSYLQSVLGIGGLPAGYRLLRVIGRVVIKGLYPLNDQIKSESEG